MNFKLNLLGLCLLAGVFASVAQAVPDYYGVCKALYPNNDSTQTLECMKQQKQYRNDYLAVYTFLQSPAWANNLGGLPFNERKKLIDKIRDKAIEQSLVQIYTGKYQVSHTRLYIYFCQELSKHITVNPTSNK